MATNPTVATTSVSRGFDVMEDVVHVAPFENRREVRKFVTENRLGSDCYSSDPTNWLRKSFVLEGDKLTVTGRGVSLTAVALDNSFFLPPAEGSNQSEGINIGHGSQARSRMILELMNRNPNKFNY